MREASQCGLQRSRLAVDEQRRADLDHDAGALGRVCVLTAARSSTSIMPARSARSRQLRARSMTSSSFFIAASTPLPVAPDIGIGVLRTRRLKSASLRSSSSSDDRIDLVEGDDFRLFGERRAIGLELLANDAVGGDRIVAGDIDEMQQHRAALDMAEKTRAESVALMRAFDEARNVGEDEARSCRRAPRQAAG